MNGSAFSAVESALPGFFPNVAFSVHVARRYEYEAEKRVSQKILEVDNTSSPVYQTSDKELFLSEAALISRLVRFMAESREGPDHESAIYFFGVILERVARYNMSRADYAIAALERVSKSYRREIEPRRRRYSANFSAKPFIEYRDTIENLKSKRRREFAYIESKLKILEKIELIRDNHDGCHDFIFADWEKSTFQGIGEIINDATDCAYEIGKAIEADRKEHREIKRLKVAERSVKIAVLSLGLAIFLSISTLIATFVTNRIHFMAEHPECSDELGFDFYLDSLLNNKLNC